MADDQIGTVQQVLELAERNIGDNLEPFDRFVMVGVATDLEDYVLRNVACPLEFDNRILKSRVRQGRAHGREKQTLFVLWR